MANILLIDDEPLVCEALQLTLERAGHAVSTASNGQEGLDQWQGAKFDLVITDILMPEKEGIELIHELRQIDPAVRIIAVTGGARVQNIDLVGLAKRHGADFAFAKPIDRAKLIDAVASCLAAPRMIPPQPI
jgi:CheY-like chemotaxis protein